MLETVLLTFLIGAYYAVEGRRFLSLERIAEPVFALNLCYLLNFPARAVVILVFGDAIEIAPALEWDFDTCNAVLVYATACMLVFNYAYQYFSGRRVFRAVRPVAALPPLQAMPIPVSAYFGILAAVVIYLMLNSRTSVNFFHDLGENDVPQIVNAIWFALDASICASLMMWLITRRSVYLAAFAIFLASFLYHSFLLTAKYALLGYLAIVLLILKRAGFAIRSWHLAVGLLVVVPYVIGSNSVRDVALDSIAPEATLAGQTSLILNSVEESSLAEVVNDLFLSKMTDRFVYLEAFMVYLQAIEQDMALDLYDKFGSLPTYKLAIPSIFGVDKSSIQNIHLWFANKYWYGLPFDGYGVVVPFGRVTESFMIFGWAGFLFFAFYAWLFAWLYKRFYCSPDPLMVIYYLIIFYYYILVDDNLLFNVSMIVYGSVFFFGSMLALRFVLKHTTGQTAQPAEMPLARPPG
jgi:hypothetical protein